ncbi:MAG: ribosome maturation factor RimM [Thioalkalispiraceae bacterium]|jgi:16S rRNA processing protein RimM
MDSNPSHPVIIGTVAGVFGIKGWLKIRSETDPPSNILQYSPWFLHKNGQWLRYDVEQGQRHNKGLIAHLQGCDDRDLAASLVGYEIAVDRSQLPETAEGEYYWSDLIGLNVVNRQGRELGKIKDLMQTGANDVLIVQNGENEVLIPYVMGHYIDTVDLSQGRMVVDWEWDLVEDSD